MNTLIVIASLMAVASATPGLAGLGYSGVGYSGVGYSGVGYSGLRYAGLGYAGAYATPYAGAISAYPLQHATAPGADNVEVQVAKQNHFAAHAEANARNHAVGYAGLAAPLAYAHASPLAYAHASPIAYGAHALPAAYGTTRLVDPVAIAQGAPLPTGDTVEVAAAKVAHAHAHAVAKSGLRYKRGLAYAAAPLAYSGYAHGSRAVAINAPLVHGAHSVVNAVGYAGLAAPLAYAGHAHAAYPLQHATAPGADNVEVQVAKQNHFAAHAEVNARTNAIRASDSVLSYAGYAHASPLAYAHASPIAYGAHVSPLAYGGAYGHHY